MNEFRNLIFKSMPDLYIYSAQQVDSGRVEPYAEAEQI